MKTKLVAKSLVVVAQLTILMSAPALSRVENLAPQRPQPSAASGIQADPYAEAFSGLTYTDKQKEAIGKIRQDIDSRKATILKDDKLTQDQKDALLTGYTRLEYKSIYDELTPEQKKQVSTRMHAQRASGQSAQKKQEPRR